MNLSAIAALSRAPFLVLGPVIVFLGISTSVNETGQWSFMSVGLVLIGAIAAHVAVNALNEYQDFRSGLDLNTQRTPFSGGSGWLPDHPEHDSLALWLGVAALLVMVAVGMVLSVMGRPLLMLYGIGGTALIMFYTPWINQKPWLCLVAPGTGFGLLMVNGTHYALTGDASWGAFGVSLSVFFLVNNLLLLNQFPDLEADRDSGRRHALVVWGKDKAALVFNVFLVLAFLPLLVGWWSELLPTSVLWVMLLLPLAWWVGKGVLQYKHDRHGLLRFMGLNVVLVNLLPASLAFVLFL